MINNTPYEIVLLIGLTDLLGYDQAHLGVLQSKSELYVCSRVTSSAPKAMQICR